MFLRAHDAISDNPPCIFRRPVDGKVIQSVSVESDHLRIHGIISNALNYLVSSNIDFDVHVFRSCATEPIRMLIVPNDESQYFHADLPDDIFFELADSCQSCPDAKFVGCASLTFYLPIFIIGQVVSQGPDKTIRVRRTATVNKEIIDFEKGFLPRFVTTDEKVSVTDRSVRLVERILRAKAEEERG